jgi:hypothetical protein
MKKFWKRRKNTLTVHPLGDGRYRLDGIDSLSAVGDTERFVQQMEALRTMPPTVAEAVENLKVNVQRMSAAPDPGPEPFVITLTGGRWKIGDGEWKDIPAGTEAVVHVESGYFDAPVSSVPWTIPTVPPGARKGLVEFRGTAVKFCYHPNEISEWKVSADPLAEAAGGPGVLRRHIRRCPDCPAC